MTEWTQAYWARRALWLVQMVKRAKHDKQPAHVVTAIKRAAEAHRVVANMLKDDNAESACEACGGSGVLFDTGSDRRSTLERCDACKRFNTDEDAMSAVRQMFNGE